jgi:hypothetical protein
MTKAKQNPGKKYVRLSDRILRGCLKRAPFFIYWDYVHFFCSSKRNEPKKRRPEKPTSALSCACYTGFIGATERAEVRTFSGLPSRNLKI